MSWPLSKQPWSELAKEALRMSGSGPVCSGQSLSGHVGDKTTGFL